MRTCLLSLALCTGAQAGASAETRQPTSAAVVRPPAGFEALLEPQQILSDIYFGGVQVGQARIRHQPGKISIDDPHGLVRQLPGLLDVAAVEAALRGRLDANSALVCSPGRSTACGDLTPEVAGIIYDENTFRLYVFVNPALLEVRQSARSGFIPAPTTGFALASTFNAALAGTVGNSAAFNLQNRTVIGFKNARVRSETSVSSSHGLLADTLVGEVDRGPLRYSAGLFWAPGIDFTGDRKLVGASVSTQYDTRVDKELLSSTPLVVFLPQPALVEILRDGRLLSTERRPAGNQALDTSGLPDGSYQVELRIQEAGGGTRTERRLFIKNRQLVPEGQPSFFAQAGYLTTTQDRLFPELGKNLFLQVGAAKRVSKRVGIDATLVQYRQNLIGQLGATALTKLADVRVAALAAARGDHGALLQASSPEQSPVGFQFDLRRVWSSGGKPLLPLSGTVAPLSQASVSPAEEAGSFAQASGNISLRFQKAELGLLAAYRSDSRGHTYAVGPRLQWSVAQRGATFVSLHAEATRSNRASAAFVGLRVQTARARASVGGSIGAAYLSDSSAPGSRTEAVGQVAGSLQRTIGQTDVAVEAGYERNIEVSLVRGGARARGPLGSASGDLQHDLDSGTTQYSLNVRTGVAMTPRTWAVGGREIADSGIIVGVDGEAGGGTFEILINDVPRAQLSAGGRVPIFLPPYREYSVRIRPSDGPRVAFDTSARRVTLYPGNVEPLQWKVEPIMTAFGRVVRPNGAPAANAEISTRRGIGRTDEKGFFQIEIGAAEVAMLKWPDQKGCAMKLSSGPPKAEYVSLGTLICE